MNPPNTAQIVKTRLLDKVLPSESLLSLSVTLGILNLKIIIKYNTIIGCESICRIANVCLSVTLSENMINDTHIRGQLPIR